MANEVGECKQLQLLRVTIRKATEDVVNSLLNDDAARLLPEVPNYKKSKTLKLTKVLKDTIISAAEINIETILQAEEFDKVLRKRESIIQEQKHLEGTIAWRPTGTVTEDVRSRDISILKKKIQQMGEMCRRENVEVNTLHRKVREVRSHNQRCERNLTDAKAQFDELKSNLGNEKAVNTRLANSLYNISPF